MKIGKEKYKDLFVLPVCLGPIVLRRDYTTMHFSNKNNYISTYGCPCMRRSKHASIKHCVKGSAM